jgi:hypothetical protein
VSLSDEEASRIVQERIDAGEVLPYRAALNPTVYLEEEAYDTAVDAEAAQRFATSRQDRGEETDWRQRIRLTPASKFKIKPVRWAWSNRMPVGEITLIPGREGVGKSTFLARIAADVTNGNLPGVYLDQPRAVLYAASEDSWHYTIAPRMKAAGANLDLVFRIDVVEDGQTSGLILPRDCRWLPEIAEESKAVMLMCDPIMSMVDDKLNSFRAQELRKALEPLRRYAEKAQLAVPALVHFNKGQGSDVGTLISGSRAWAEVARAVIAIAQDKDADEYTCVVSQTKNNLGRSDLPNLAYTIDSVTLETDEGEDAHVGRLRWLADSERSVEDILGAVVQEDRRGDTATQILAWVVSQAHARGRAVSTGDVVAQFAGSIQAATVRQNLRRLVKSESLRSPSQGLYLPLGFTVSTP